MGQHVQVARAHSGHRPVKTMTLTLFNIYFNAIMARWRVHSEVAGVTVLYKHGRRLVDDRTVMERVQATESQFADDLALYAGIPNCI